MRTIVTVLLIFVLLAVAYNATIRAAENPIVPAGAKLELLFTRTANIAGGLTEGPAVAPDGSIYFTDMPFGSDKGMILRFDPATKKTTVFTDDSGKANGLTCDAQGNLVACEGADDGGRRVSRWDRKTGKSRTVADRYQGKQFNSPNDLCIDTKGRIYFTDPRYLGTEPRELEHRAVYRIDTDGKVVEVTHDVEKPNGMALSPDEKTLYVGDHNNGTDRIDPNAAPPKIGAMKVFAFPLGPDGLVNGPKRTLVDFGQENGCDGMCVDQQRQHLPDLPQLEAPRPAGHRSDGQGIGLRAHGAREPARRPRSRWGCRATANSASARKSRRCICRSTRACIASR